MITTTFTFISFCLTCTQSLVGINLRYKTMDYNWIKKWILKKLYNHLYRIQINNNELGNLLNSLWIPNLIDNRWACISNFCCGDNYFLYYFGIFGVFDIILLLYFKIKIMEVIRLQTYLLQKEAYIVWKNYLFLITFTKGLTLNHCLHSRII